MINSYENKFRICPSLLGGSFKSCIFFILVVITMLLIPNGDDGPESTLTLFESLL